MPCHSAWRDLTWYRSWIREESDHVARMCLKIPIDNGWGLSDLVIEEREGEEWLRWCGTRYRPLETVRTLGEAMPR